MERMVYVCTLLTDIFGTLEDPKEFDEEKLFAED